MVYSKIFEYIYYFTCFNIYLYRDRGRDTWVINIDEGNV